MPFNLAEARLSTIKELQKQLKKLKERDQRKREIKEEYWEKGWEQGKCDTWDEIDETVKPLKEEIKKLKEENDKLKQELGKKETSLHYYACMWHVTGCDDTPTKEEIEDYLNRNMPVVGGDEEDVKRELWEQFGYEEEDED